MSTPNEARVVVITGSTRGIGLGLAAQFLARGCRVCLHGRSTASLEAPMKTLDSAHGDRVTGFPGDVCDPTTHERLWAHAVERFGRVDVWINNAGVGHPELRVWELTREAVDRVIDNDVKGLIYGCQVALRGMRAQGHGHLYNMEGFGSDGRTRPGITVYGAAKAAVRFLNRSLAQEVAGTPVKVSALSPGIVITDFLTDQYVGREADFLRAKKVFNALGDKVETVTPWLVERVLHNERNGARIEWLTTGKVLWRFATAGIRKRELFAPPVKPGP